MKRGSLAIFAISIMLIAGVFLLRSSRSEPQKPPRETRWKTGEPGFAGKPDAGQPLKADDGSTAPQEVHIQFRDSLERPVGGVECHISFGGERKSCKADSNGLVTFSTVLNRDLQVEVVWEGVEIPAAAKVLTAAIAHINSTVRLPLAPLEGILLDEGGIPIAQVKITAMRVPRFGAQDDVNLHEPATTSTHADGSFCFPNLICGPEEDSQGDKYFVSAQAGQRGTCVKTAYVRWGQSNRCDLVTVRQQVFNIKGKVVDRSSQVVPGARVRLRAIRKREDSTSLKESDEVVTDAQGKFVVTLSFGGEVAEEYEHSIRVRSSTYAELEQPLDLLHMGPDSDITLVLDKGGIISGQVIDEDSVPLSKVRVYIRRTDQDLDSPTEQLTAEDGKFTFTGLGGFEYTVSAALPLDIKGSWEKRALVKKALTAPNETLVFQFTRIR